jgi:hypothetical protein
MGASIRSLRCGTTLHYDASRSANWDGHTHLRRHRGDPASTASSGAQLLHLAADQHEAVTVVAATSTPVVAGRRGASMAP